MQRVKHYGVTAAAGGASKRVSPAVNSQSGRRTLLIIQNTGANAGLCRIGEDVRGDGSDITIAAGTFLGFTNPDTCPWEAINLRSTAGTTFSIIEGISDK
jgi:hypothetical protein